MLRERRYFIFVRFGHRLLAGYGDASGCLVGRANNDLLELVPLVVAVDFHWFTSSMLGLFCDGGISRKVVDVQIIPFRLSNKGFQKACLIQ